MRVFRIEPQRRRALVRTGLAVLSLATGACSLLPFKPSHAGESPTVGVAGSSLTMAGLQGQVLRYADSYVASVSHATDEVARKLGTRQASVDALKWKLDQANAAYANATGENPVWNTLDMVVFATVSRMVIEDARSSETFGTAVAPLLATHRELEANAWTLAGELLKPEQRQELEALIVEWRKQNPHERSVGAVHFHEFALGLEQDGSRKKLQTASIFTLLRLDPFAGLDPTTVAIEQSRELAERTVAYAERAPNLLRWQAELLTYQLAAQPEALQILADAARVSRSMEQVGNTAEGLPALVEEQRKAAIDQLMAGVAAERAEILANLNAHEAQVQSLLGQAKTTLDAGTQMSNSLDATVKSLDAFIHYVSPPPPKDGPPPAPTGKPFNVLDYGKTAADVGAMARDLNALLQSADKSAPAIAKWSQQTGEDLKQVVDHAFWRGLILILTLLVGSVPAALAYRALARRLFAPQL
jgi:hypothetical protein